MCTARVFTFYTPGWPGIVPAALLLSVPESARSLYMSALLGTRRALLKPAGRSLRCSSSCWECLQPYDTTGYQEHVREWWLQSSVQRPASLRGRLCSRTASSATSGRNQPS